MATEPIPHTRYKIDKLIAHAVDPYTKENINIEIEGNGTLTLESVMRNTAQEDNRAKVFDGNQANVIMQIHEAVATRNV